MMESSEDKLENDQLNDDLQDYKIITTDPKQSPIRLDKFLMDRLEKVSRNRVQNAIRSGSVTVNGKEIKPNFKVKPGQEISIVVPRPPSEFTAVVPQNIPLDIRYEDDDLMIVYKPAGLVVHPGIGNRSGTLVNALAYYFGHQEALDVEGSNYQQKMGLVHRIDKNTSGLLVVAKSDYALTHLAKQFFHHTIERTYYALVWGEPKELQGTIEGHIGRHPRFRQKQEVYPDGDHGKWALTHYEVIEPMYYVSLVKCQLETGRTHQIRVHMKHIGHPLFNDDRYGGDKIVKGTVFSKYKRFVENCFNLIPRHALHAKSLGFVHPTTGEKMFFDSELPEDMTTVLDTWRRYLNSRKNISG